ncbi:DNA-binding transcriptional regulator, MerR family [Blastococcus sp. DSM 46786]|uniref:MerR family transcriptional regulator n=1 Tax=Blastococcus sp. DSM 46786 TaxID=1798227 RepID=UPI0008C3D096|nr:MerR family transcriptional regulator [Blastococcus sp. DSM 46786]SEL81529.1 DNA-binding transcriptional regulator, MerR family [Blastococcus sp. DSM 46786]
MNVGEVAAMAGVTVRTLHHYDRIGLLSPSGRTAAGYRQYAPADLDRLHRVLLFRELGFPLEEVATLLAGLPAGARAELARRGGRRVLLRLERTQAMVAAVEKEMEARAMGIALTPEERFEVFGEHDPEQYEAEVQERWGETDAYAESKRRAAAYSKEDWLRVKAEGDDVERRFAEAPAAGAPADSERAMDLAEEHRQQISRNFYDCPPEMHAGLGGMYVEDERFTAHYEQRAPGLARYVSAAVQANADRQG